MFPIDLILCLYKMFPSLRDIMVSAGPYSHKTIKKSRSRSWLQWFHEKIWLALKLSLPYITYQVVQSTENREPRLYNYKSRIKNKGKPRLTVKHFIESCTDTVNPATYLRFILIDYVTNTENSSKEEFDDLPLEKENFWMGTLWTIHRGFNNYHHWRRVRRNQKFNINTH